jgi:hypothetical protein
LDKSKGQGIVHQSVFEKEVFTEIDSSSPKTLLALFLATDATMDKPKFNKIHTRLNSFLSTLQAGKSDFRSDKKYLRWVYDQVRFEFFRQYQPYPRFDQLFSNGLYNCLSGTAIYGLLLQQLGYAVEIHETAFHAYLLVKLPKKNFLIDATDPLNGFIIDQYSIKQRELMYKQSELAKHQPAFNRVISFAELAGLQYYNEATLQYNQQHYIQSGNLLNKAFLLYSRSERISYLQTTSVRNQQAKGVSQKENQKKNIYTTAPNGLSNR